MSLGRSPASCASEPNGIGAADSSDHQFSACGTFDQVLCDMKLKANNSRAVVLVHGIWDTSRVFARMARWLEGRGFRALAVDLTPSDGAVGLEELAAQLAEFVNRKLAPRRVV